jgi:tetratricopeptide (TPR) repeat protein
MMKRLFEILVIVLLLNALYGGATAQTLTPLTDRATTHIQDGDYKSAAVELKQAVQADPQDAFAWFLLAVSYGQLREWNESVEAYRKTLSLNPNPQWGKVDAKMIRAGLAQAEQNARAPSGVKPQDLTDSFLAPRRKDSWAPSLSDCADQKIRAEYPILCKYWQGQKGDNRLSPSPLPPEVKSDPNVTSDTPSAQASKQLGSKSSEAQVEKPSITKQQEPQPSTGKSTETNIHGFVFMLNFYINICQIKESMARDSGVEEIVTNARSCSQQPKADLAKDYTKFLKQVQKDKPTAMSKFKELFTTWWGIMGAMPRLTLTKNNLQLEQQKDKRIFQEKKAAFETEFLF